MSAVYSPWKQHRGNTKNVAASRRASQLGTSPRIFLPPSIFPLPRKRKQNLSSLPGSEILALGLLIIISAPITVTFTMLPIFGTRWVTSFERKASAWHKPPAQRGYGLRATLSFTERQPVVAPSFFFSRGEKTSEVLLFACHVTDEQEDPSKISRAEY